jgi:hypothetical protein
MQNLDMETDLFGGHGWICTPQQDMQGKAACSRVVELNPARGRLDAASRDDTKCTDLHLLLRVFCEGKDWRHYQRQFLSTS